MRVTRQGSWRCVQMLPLAPLKRNCGRAAPELDCDNTTECSLQKWATFARLAAVGLCPIGNGLLCVSCLEHTRCAKFSKQSLGQPGIDCRAWHHPMVH